MAGRAIWSVMITVVIKHALNQAMSLRWAAWPMRRKFHELHVTGKSQIAEQALVLIQKLYAIEAELRKRPMVQRKTAANTDNSIVNQ